jgi:hypothetical protein
MWKLTLGYGIHTHILSLSSGKQKPAKLLAPNSLKGVSEIMMDNQYNDNLQLRKPSQATDCFGCNNETETERERERERERGTS